jgi:CRP-like cAMP-binding protein
VLEDNMNLLRAAPMFESLTEADLRDVAQRLIALDFEPGDMLFREGAPGRYICFLTAGRLDVWKRSPGADPVVIATIDPGRAVGEMSIIDGLTCSATVTARDAASVLALKREDFEQILEESPRLGAEIYKGISRLLSMSLRRTTQDLADARSEIERRQ